MGLIVEEKEREKKIYNLEYNLVEKEKINQENQTYLGNTNMFWVNFLTYRKVIKKTQGRLQDFANPKFNADQKSFKTVNRKENLLQDIVQHFPDVKKITVLSYKRNFCFSPVKNQLIDLINRPQEKFYTPLQAEEIDFRNNRKIIAKMGNRFLTKKEKISFLKHIFISDKTKIVLHPNYRLQRNSKPFVRKSIFHPQSIFIVNLPTIVISELELLTKSALIIEGNPQAKLIIDKVKIKNQGYALKPLKEKDYSNPQTPFYDKIFGYEFKWKNPLRIHLAEKGQYRLTPSLKIVKE